MTEDRSIIITADVGSESLLVFWNSKTGTPVKSIPKPHAHGIIAIDISPGGEWLATVSAPNPATGEQEVSGVMLDVMEARGPRQGPSTCGSWRGSSAQCSSTCTTHLHAATYNACPSPLTTPGCPHPSHASPSYPPTQTHPHMRTHTNGQDHEYRRLMEAQRLALAIGTCNTCLSLRPLSCTHHTHPPPPHTHTRFM